MTVPELIRTKRAVRQFTNEPLSEEAIRTILNAGRRAQSSKNTQPWHFIAIRDRATLQQLAQCGAYAGHLAGAPFAIALISSVADGFDLGQAAANMQLAAWELGLPALRIASIDSSTLNNLVVLMALRCPGAIRAIAPAKATLSSGASVIATPSYSPKQ